MVSDLHRFLTTRQLCEGLVVLSQANVTIDRLIAFAKAEGRMQRRYRVPYITDTDVAAVIRGWLNCRAVFFGVQTVLAHDLDAAILAFRRERRLVPRKDRSQRSLAVVSSQTTPSTAQAA